MKKISIVVPFYNEKNRVNRSVLRLVKYLEQSQNLEILFVDDGSTDDCQEQLNQVLQSFQNVFDKNLHQFKILTNPKNTGKGGAVRLGVLNAQGPFILYTDFDFSIELKALNRFVNVLALQPHQKGLIIASRKLDTTVNRQQSLMRKWMGKIFNLMMKFIIDVPVGDTQCGFKLIDKETAQKVFAPLGIKGFAFDVEIIKRVLWLKLPVIEESVSIEHDDADSTVNIYLDPLKMLKDLVKLRWRIFRFGLD
jgi:dolichyl-phosphate beta-glucosyltransferase